MLSQDQAIQPFADWYGSLRRRHGEFPARGTITGALVVLERLKSNFNLDIDAHTAAGGSQIAGAGPSPVRHILQTFGETRTFVVEGGRTNRGLRGDIKGMLDAIRRTGLADLPQDERIAVLILYQAFLVERIREYYNQQRLAMAYDPSRITRLIIRDLLTTAGSAGKAGPVAQHLVGAKLDLRFPDCDIEHASYSTADQPRNAPGDFLVGSTAFHVTVSPMPAVYEKCKRNLADGFRVLLLVPDSLLQGTRQNADLAAEGRIAVEAIESFVSQNIEELACFKDDHLKSGLRRLLEQYNALVDRVETDKSLMIEIPPRL